VATTVEISKGLVLINALSSVGTRALRIGVLLWLHQYLLKRLDAAEYAPYPVIISFVLFLQILVSILTGGIARYVTDAYATDNRAKITEIISSMMPMIAWGLTAFVVLGGLAAWHVDSILNIEPRLVGDAQIMMALLVVSQAIALFLAPFSVGLHVRQKFTWMNMVVLGQEVVQLGIMCVLLFGVSTRVLWVVVAASVGTVLYAVVCSILSRRLIPELRFDRRAIRRSTRSELTRFGAWMMLGNVVYRVRTSVDAIILNRFSDATEVNAFHIGSLPDRQMNQFVTMASGVLQPALTAMHATNQDETLRSAYLRGNRYYMWIALAVAVPLVVFAHELVGLYVGSVYGTAAVVAIILYATYPLTYASEMLYRIAVAKAQVRTYMTITVGSSVTKIGLSILFIGSLGFGAIGAAMSTAAVTAVFQLVLLWPLGLRMLQLPFSHYLRETLVPGLTPAAVAGGCCLVLRQAFPGTTWPTLILDISIGSAVYAVVMFLSLRPQDRTDFGRVFERIKRPFKRRRSKTDGE
jgi:O-antigen/teichoic acid export membrane protein